MKRLSCIVYDLNERKQPLTSRPWNTSKFRKTEPSYIQPLRSDEKNSISNLKTQETSM